WGLGLANTLPTRRWPVALAASAGRTLLFAAALGWADPQQAHSQSLALAGLALWSASLALEAWLPAGPPAARPIDRIWRDFRDRFGLLWGLRVAERFNASARKLQWGVRLGWQGLDVDPHHPRTELDPDTAALVRQNLDALLRRFVSPEWLATRWENRLD
ncbi:MAG: hypothetical protein JNG90_11190, partial [Planctomycetaceae bacterium]|nr:hypothetical protein [Planctomycetaceae bacterium]